MLYVSFVVNVSGEAVLLYSCGNVLVMTSELVSTGEAAKAIGVGRATLARWWANGLVTPELVTAGGHARWNVKLLRAQLKDRRQPDEG